MSNIFLSTLFFIVLLFLLLLFAKAYKKRKKIINFFVGENIQQTNKFKLANKNYLVSLIALFLAGLILVIYLCTLPSKNISINTDIYNSEYQIMFLLDISNSMNAEDLKISRLAAAKLFILNILDALAANKNYKLQASIITFAGDADVLVPMTRDINFLEENILEITTGLCSSQGTNLELALNTARNNFLDNEFDSKKILILLTDAEHHEADFANEIVLLKSQNIKTQCIGFGTTAGARIPIQDNLRSYMQDWQGNEIITKLNLNILKKIDPDFKIYPTNINTFVDNLFENSNNTKKANNIKHISNFQYILLIFLFIVLIYSFYKYEY